MTDDTLTDSLSGQQLDEYRLEALLGQGGMACVYRGFDVRLKRWAAIKVINAPFRADSDYATRFEREARAIAQLRHPHIVSVYRYGEVNGLLYIAMEYIEGADLEAVLMAYREKQQSMPSEEASRIIRQVCLALDYAHSKGVIHRDIKPSNIMVDQQGNTNLTDFGLVLLEDHKTRGEIFGTPHYISPEQAIFSAGAVPQSDLYSVGVILYEMFTAKLPFEASHPYDVAMLHLSEPPPPPRATNPDLSPELEAVILKALAKEPEDRYPTGVALADALDQALQVTSGRTSALPTDRSFAEPSSRPRAEGQGAVKLALPEPQDEALGASGPQGGEAGQPLPPMPAAVGVPVRQPAKKGKLMTPRYILKNVRLLLTELTEKFTEAELRQLCFDLPDFRPVHHQLARSSGKAEIVDRLLEYAEQTLQIEGLLALAKEHNPAIYEKHRPYYELVSAGKTDLVGRNLGKYHIVDRLGQGGMADVYKAYQPGLARYVAIKVMRHHLADDEEFVERFESEAMAVADLHHPNIVQAFDFDREDDRYYMVMEFVAGPTLKAELKEHRDKDQLFTLAETVSIFKSLASAIDYAHARGMVHRDLKPGNVMFTPERRVVLTDFGIARITSAPSYTMTNAIVGTPAYMSPEQAQGQRADARSDIYSLGVILYELVTGRLPFEGDTPFAIIMQLVSGSVLPPTTVNPDLPEAVERVILRAMSENPAGRYQTAGQMAQALQEVVEKTDTQTLRSGRIRIPPPTKQDKDGPRDLAIRSQAEVDESDEVKALQKAELPEVKVPSPLSGSGDRESRGEPDKSGTPITISTNSGQVAFGGEQVVQIGNISGGQVSIGPGHIPPQSTGVTEPGTLAKPGTTLIGRRLGQYFITEQVGKGSIARVYRGRHEGLQQDVAVKVLFAHLADDEEFMARFRREAQAVATLRHPHIVQVHDFGTHGELYYVVMEYVTGGTLKDQLAGVGSGGGALPLTEVGRLIREVATALDYAHARGIVHRDLKPANIMFTATGQVVLTDFGLAPLMGAMRHTMTRTSWHLPTYISPEQAQGERGDERSDIYSLGVILYELVTGRVPFEADKPIALIMKHVSEPVPPPRRLNPGLPATVEPVILKALAKEPGARYQTAGELAKALAYSLLAPSAGQI